MLAAAAAAAAAAAESCVGVRLLSGDIAVRSSPLPRLLLLLAFFECSLSPGLGDEDDGDANCLRMETVFFGTVLGVDDDDDVVIPPPPEPPPPGEGDDCSAMGDDSRGIPL